MSATAPAILSHDDLQDRLSYWKGVLRLNDWDIKVVVKRGFDMPHDTQGRCEWVLSRKEAFIKILHPDDFDPTCSYPQDMEATLVHELTHLHMGTFAAVEEDSPLDIAMEQAIHAISYALVGLQRTIGVAHEERQA